MRLGRGQKPRHLPRRPSSGGSPGGSARRRRRSPSATRSSSSPGTCSPTTPTTRTSAATTSSSATPSGPRAVRSASSRRLATASPSNPPPDRVAYGLFTFQCARLYRASTLVALRRGRETYETAALPLSYVGARPIIGAARSTAAERDPAPIWRTNMIPCRSALEPTPSSLLQRGQDATSQPPTERKTEPADSRVASRMTLKSGSGSNPTSPGARSSQPPRMRSGPRSRPLRGTRSPTRRRTRWIRARSSE